jgi:acyl-phosphate glycerol 3-phosphate acyltransferase
MDPILLLSLTCLGAYLIGAIPFGFLVARWRGVDIFHAGSGNIGATNVGRVLGRRFGILVFVLDFAKGALPVAAALALRRLGEPSPDSALALAALPVGAGLAAFLGHLFPVYLRFRGGKGIATGAGVVAVLLPLPALGAIGTWLVVLAATRYVSVASLAAAVALCGFHLAVTPAPLADVNCILTVFCSLAAGLVFLRHRANITRLLRGNENRLQDTPAMQLLGKTLHVLAVGLWFGTAVFFTFVVTLSLFQSFESEAQKPKAERPAWFRFPDELDRDAALRKEQGSRAAGFAVGPLFDYYFLLQGLCGFAAAVTALGWARGAAARVHKVRAVVVLLALGTVVAGWPIERKVGELRDLRNQAVDRERAQPSQAELVAQADTLRKEFRDWHLYSLLLNFVTLILVTVAMALAARLPEQRAPAAETHP